MAMLTEGCDDPPEVTILSVIAGPPLTTTSAVPTLQGGFGSGLSLGPDGSFYLLTDRGPNYDAGVETKAFPIPQFGPQVGVFQRTSEGLELRTRIPLRLPDGTPITGLPNPPGTTATGEVAVSPEGERLALDPNGLDPEDLHVLDDGSFWVADEYGPALIHFGADGRLLERIGPAASGMRSLPLVLTRRRPNYGFEGLTGDRSGATLVALLQSALNNSPDSAGGSPMTRLVRFDTRSGTSRQFLYRLDDPQFFATGLAQLSPTTFLVLERDNWFLGGDPPAGQKKVFLIDLADATDVSDPANRPEGLTVGGRPLEALTDEQLAEAGIRPVKKSLVVDLVALGYPHDKPEGIVTLSPSEIAIVNDDDFGIVDVDGKPGIKRLPSTGKLDRNAVWIIRLPGLVERPRP